jgi:AraC-like DNA-binding protein
MARSRPAAPPPANDFPAIPLNPEQPYDQIRTLYVHREPELLAAIRRGDRASARQIVNHILVHIYAAGQERSELLKGLLLELVVMLARAAIECGAAQSEVLGLNFRHITELATIDDDEALAAWLRRIFEHVFNVIDSHSRPAQHPSVAKALACMRENLGRDLDRAEVARHAATSPGRLSRLLREATGLGFADALRALRVEAAATLLRTTDRKLSDIAAACGFCDQSHFSHTFRHARGMTPRQFRESRPGA